MGQYMTHWAEIEQEARQRPGFPKLFGMNNSVGMTNPKELYRQYMAHKSAMETLAMGWMMKAAIPVVVFALMGIIGSFWGAAHSESQADTTSLGATWSIFHSLIAIAFSILFVGLPCGALLALRDFYNAAYAEAIILEHGNPIVPGQITAIGTTNLLRLAFANRSNKGYFFGSTQSAGIDKGKIVLSTQTRLDEMPYLRLPYLDPGHGTFVGNTASDTYALVSQAGEAADLQRRMKRNKLDLLTDNAVIIACVIALVLCLLQAQGGYGFDVTALDLDFQKYVQTGGGGQ